MNSLIYAMTALIVGFSCPCFAETQLAERHGVKFAWTLSQGQKDQLTYDLKTDETTGRTWVNQVLGKTDHFEAKTFCENFKLSDHENLVFQLPTEADFNLAYDHGFTDVLDQLISHTLWTDTVARYWDYSNRTFYANDYDVQWKHAQWEARVKFTCVSLAQ